MRLLGPNILIRLSAMDRLRNQLPVGDTLSTMVSLQSSGVGNNLRWESVAWKCRRKTALVVLIIGLLISGSLWTLMPFLSALM